MNPPIRPIPGRVRAALTLCLAVAVVPCRAADDPAPVEVSDEPHHHAVFDNGAVRVLEVEIPPGETTQYHRHRVDNAAVSLADTSAVGQRLGEPPAPPARRKAGGMNFSRASGDGYVHRVTNVGDGPFRVVDVEFLRAPGAVSPADPTAPPPSMDNERLRAYTLEIPPGGTSGPLRLADGIRVVVAGDALELSAEGADSRALDLSAHRWAWRTAGTASLRNRSDKPALVVEIEIK